MWYSCGAHNRLAVLCFWVLSVVTLAGCASIGSGTNPAPGGFERYAGMDVKLPVSAAFGPDRRLWRVVPTDDHVYVDSSSDYGKTFSPPVAVNPERVPIRAQSEYRPQIAVEPAGRVYVAYPAFGLQPWTSYLSVSADRGQHFSTPEPLSDKARIANSFQTILAIAPNGDLHAFWHDEREGINEARGNDIFHTALDAQGKTAQSNHKIVDGVCSCCRLAVDFDTDGRPVLLTRFIYPGNVRDHGLLKPKGNSAEWAAARATVDDWEIEACPVHGPALSIGPNGRYHIAWFTQGKKRQGLFYAYSDDQARRFSEPVALGDPHKLPAHPDVLAMRNRVVLAWNEFDGKKNRAMVKQSRDSGKTWSEAVATLESDSDVDFPFLLTDGQAIFLSWNSQDKGYRLIRID
ncbi:exo-alpha-sialidase [Methylocaldum sp.]|uniref:exo-alpha-sialidase n=1 Tax=Methylocaldum sp. TaxID=1969727 RepID=UPI002D22AAE6|nr:exo-alpha-sialidase [Methylocaldum sp.]HYE34022.1 exo-alpha-sialidase [Methylocaldum sp.]